eukprot:486953_1
MLFSVTSSLILICNGVNASYCMKTPVLYLIDSIYGLYSIKYSTGVFMQYDALTPLHINIKEEVTENNILSIPPDIFEDAIITSKNFIKTTKAQKFIANESDEFYGIKKDDSIHIEHCISINIYCSKSDLCTEFRKSYRAQNKNDTKNDIINRHCANFYWLGRNIYSAIQFYGKKYDTPKAENNLKIYHALSLQFVFDNFSTIWEMPTSTVFGQKYSSSGTMQCLDTFRGNNGIILRLSPKYNGKMNYNNYLFVGDLSPFPGENERLFAGKTILAITNIITRNNKINKSLQKYIKPILYFERITQQTVHNKKYYNHGYCKQKKK